VHEKRAAGAAAFLPLTQSTRIEGRLSTMTIPLVSPPSYADVSATNTDELALSTLDPESPGDIMTSPLADAPIQTEIDLVAESEVAHQEEEYDDDDDDDDDELTVIILDNETDDRNGDQQAAIAWIEQTGPEMEERRRNVLLGELRRVQRASFIHFLLLCLIPTALLIIVIATVVGEEEDCESDATFCELEPRTFINAFTTRCVCDSIPVDRQSP